MGAAVVIPLAARRKAMMAAEHVDTHNVREAAILGGLVRSVIACGRINVSWSAQYAVDMIREFKLPGVDTCQPGPTEMQMMVERFQESYSQPFS